MKPQGPASTHAPHLLLTLTMSASNDSGAASHLTLDEQILHHHAAKVKKDVEAYRTYSRKPQDWRDLFTNHLARFIL